MYISGSEGQQFLNSIHGKLGCVSCHGGSDPAASIEEAHQGVNKNPSADSEKNCGGCHAELVSTFANSIHFNQQGYLTLFNQRYTGNAVDEAEPEFMEGFKAECGTCHATCGQCHVSRPNTVRSGLIRNHQFMKTPDMTNTCTACHGSRIGDEYLGTHEGLAADVHWIPNGKRCEFCHTASEMHGSQNSPQDKMHVEEMPRCENCHQKGTNAYHVQHWGDVSCSVCHSQPYRNCNSCHVGEGITGSSYLDFKIGKNPLPDKREYKWVTLRHIPIAPDTYTEWGYPDLPNYDKLPSWKYSMPHNIIKNTSQAAPDSSGNCGGNCHGIEEIYLRPADLHPDEAAANDKVVVKDSEWPVGPTNN